MSEWKTYNRLNRDVFDLPDFQDKRHPGNPKITQILIQTIKSADL